MFTYLRIPGLGGRLPELVHAITGTAPAVALTLRNLRDRLNELENKRIDAKRLGNEVKHPRAGSRGRGQVLPSSISLALEYVALQDLTPETPRQGILPSSSKSSGERWSRRCSADGKQNSATVLALQMRGLRGT